MHQDDEDRKNEVIVKGLEDKIKKLKDSLKEKDELRCSAEGSLAEANWVNSWWMLRHFWKKPPANSTVNLKL
jgi:hypothetical protein